MTDLQNAILGIYKKVATICNENSIDFFAIGGTCLGAVRHKGFIPWDDDIDIAIPIEQFKKFKQCMKSQLPSNLYLYDCTEKKEYRQLFCKVCDSNTTFIEETEINYPNVYKGVYIDIMPLSGVPGDKDEQKKFIKKLSLYQAMNFINRYPFNEMNTWKTKLAWIALRMLRIDKRFTLYSNTSFQLLEKYPLIDSEYTGYVWSSNLFKLVFPKDYFKNYIKLTFEDTTMRCPVGYDAYLKQQFGDYMKLPPMEQRIQHHRYIVDLEHSYKDYLEGKKTK